MSNIIDITRMYALPMSIFSWFAAFSYSYANGGNLIYGLIALVGICLVHLGVNVFDDYIDYKFLPKTVDKDNKIILHNAQKGKCEYILNNSITHKQMLLLAFLLFFLALFIGLFFTIKVGLLTLFFMILAGVLGLFYPFAGNFRLCETILAIIYGPILFGGVFYVMSAYYDWHTLLVCLPTTIMTVNMLYTDTVMDYDIDNKQRKKTIANFFKTKKGSYNFQIILLLLAYISAIVCYLQNLASILFLLICITIPQTINLLKSMNLYIKNPQKIPNKNIFDGITEKWDMIKQEGSESFMLRMYQARNLMILFSFLFGVALLIRF